MAVTEQIQNIILNSKQGDELPVATVVQASDLLLIWSNANDRLERINSNLLIQNVGNDFITIGNDRFRRMKGYTGTTKNTGSGLEANDGIGDAIILNGTTRIHIGLAIFNGGDNTNFGTYNPSTGDFTGGDYTFLQYEPLN